MTSFHNNARSQQLGDDLPQNFADPYSLRQHRGNLVEVASNMDKESITTGGTRLTQFVHEPPQSTEVIVNSADRVRGSPFNFSIDIGSPLFRARLAHVDTVVLPRQFNVTPKNNRLWIVTYGTEDGTPFFKNTGQPNSGAGKGSTAFEVVLTPGYYAINSFITELTLKLKEALRVAWYTGARVSLGTVGITTFFDPRSNQLYISYRMSSYGSEPAADPSAEYEWYWAWSSDCPFVDRGRNFIPISATGYDNTSSFIPPSQQNQPKRQLLSFNVGEDPLPTDTNISTIAFTIGSGASALIYSRFTTIRSKALYQYSYSASRSTRVSDEGNVIATIETVSDTGIEGSGKVFSTLKHLTGPYISIVNPQKQLIQFLDFEFRDEYGELIDELYPLGTGGTGPTIWLSVTF